METKVSVWRPENDTPLILFQVIWQDGWLAKLLLVKISPSLFKFLSTNLTQNDLRLPWMISHEHNCKVV